MSLAKFLEADETYLNRQDAVKYLHKKHNILPHVARMALKGKFTKRKIIGSTFDIVPEYGLDEEFSVNDLDELAKQLKSAGEDNYLQQVSDKSKKAVSRGDVYAAGYDDELMGDWRQTIVLNHVFFMKFKRPVNNTNIWEYDEIRLTPEFKYNSAIDSRTSFPVTGMFVSNYRKIDKFGELIVMGQKAIKKDQTLAIKRNDQGDLEKALSLQKVESNKPTMVAYNIMNYLLKGWGSYEEIVKEFKEMEDE